MHRRYWPREHWRWLWRDVLVPTVPALLGVWVFLLWAPVVNDRWDAMIWAVTVGGFLIGLNVVVLQWRERLSVD